MAKKDTPDTLAHDSVVDLGIVAIPAHILTGIVSSTYAKTGVVLANQRIKVILPVGDIPTEFTLSLYVQRNAVNDAESVEVAKVKAERDGAKAARDEAEQAKQSREKKAAFELGQSAVMSSLSNIGALVQGAQNLNKLVK